MAARIETPSAAASAGSTLHSQVVQPAQTEVTEAAAQPQHVRGSDPVYFKALRCAVTFCNTWPREPRKIKIFTCNIACWPGASEVSGSTCWHVSCGLLHTLPALRVNLPTTHLRSVESVATYVMLAGRKGPMERPRVRHKQRGQQRTMRGGGSAKAAGSSSHEAYYERMAALTAGKCGCPALLAPPQKWRPCGHPAGSGAVRGWSLPPATPGPRHGCRLRTLR